jgi:hybrid cluster-associated redox disulfide protein
MAETMITADMIIHDVVTRHPVTVKVFHGHGLPCTACAVGSRESIAGGARTHHFNPEKLDLLLKDLNASINGEPISVAPKKAPVGRGVPLTMASGDPNRQIKQVIAIMSGKGGVGKSLVRVCTAGLDHAGRGIDGFDQHCACLPGGTGE